MGKDSDDILTIVLMLIGCVALIIFGPAASFALSYFGGWICKVTFGGVLTDSLNLLFHTNYFSPEMLPTMAGALGWVGGFFKSVRIIKREA